MGFVKEKRNIKDEFPEWKYLNEIGVRDFLGRPIEKFTTGLVVDHENNYYLIGRGVSSPNRDVNQIWFYALCLNGEIVNLEVTRRAEGSAFDNFDFFRRS